MTSRRDDMLKTARSLCVSIALKAPVEEYLEHFSSSPDIVAVDHGLGSMYLAPFVGQNFEGKRGVKEYFSWRREIIKTVSLRFEDYVVDADAGVVCVNCRGKYLWRTTENQWEELASCRLTFDKKGMVTRYEFWGDTGAAFLASRGKLK